MPLAQLVTVLEVLNSTKIHRSTLWRMVQDGRFPPPIRLSERCIRWPENQVNDWIDARNQ